VWGANMRFVVLDRDGVIVVEHYRYLVSPQEVALNRGAVEGLREMRDIGLGLVVATNQSAIGRGLLDEDMLGCIHRRMSDLLEDIHLDGIYHCPHLPEDNCNCRKPRTGLVETAARELNFSPSDSFVIGDKASDIELGQRIGATTFLVRTGYGKVTEGVATPDYVVDDLSNAAQVIRRLIL
jgi:D-glycero-D-manno-heptose 1,7-bisphosphate phosphatase